MLSLFNRYNNLRSKCEYSTAARLQSNSLKSLSWPQPTWHHGCSEPCMLNRLPSEGVKEEGIGWRHEMFDTWCLCLANTNVFQNSASRVERPLPPYFVTSDSYCSGCLAWFFCSTSLHNPRWPTKRPQNHDIFFWLNSHIISHGHHVFHSTYRFYASSR